MLRFASTAELPEEIRAALPDEAQKLFVRVFNSAAGAGKSEHQAYKIAWRGLENEGWQKGDGGQYAQVAKRRMRAVAKRLADGNASFAISIPVHHIERVAKRDGQAEDEIQVFGWANTALDEDGVAIIDSDTTEEGTIGQRIRAPVLARAAYNYVRKSRQANAFDHFTDTCGEMIESAFFDAEKRVAMGMSGEGPTGWWTGFAIPASHPAAEAVLLRQLNELSIEGRAFSVPREDGVVDREGLIVEKITLVDLGANPRSPIELVQKRLPEAATPSGQTAASPQPKDQEMDLLAKLKAALGPSNADLYSEAEKALMAAGNGGGDKPAAEGEVAKKQRDLEAKLEDVAKRLTVEADARKASEERAAGLAKELADGKRLELAKKFTALGKPEEVAKRLETYEKLGDEGLKAEIARMEADNAERVAVFKRLGTEIGTANPETTQDPNAQLMSIAKKLLEDQRDRFSKEKNPLGAAYEAAIKANPKIYAELEASRRGAKR